MKKSFKAILIICMVVATFIQPQSIQAKSMKAKVYKVDAGDVTVLNRPSENIVWPGREYVVKARADRKYAQFVRFYVPESKVWKFTFWDLKYSSKKYAKSEDMLEITTYGWTPEHETGLFVYETKTKGGFASYLALRTKKAKASKKRELAYRPLLKRTAKLYLKKHDVCYILIENTGKRVKKGYKTMRLKIS